MSLVKQIRDELAAAAPNWKYANVSHEALAALVAYVEAADSVMTHRPDLCCCKMCDRFHAARAALALPPAGGVAKGGGE